SLRQPYERAGFEGAIEVRVVESKLVQFQECVRLPRLTERVEVGDKVAEVPIGVDKQNDPGLATRIQGRAGKTACAKLKAFEEKIATFPWLALNENVAAMLAKDFAADSQAQARAPGALGADERPEDVRQLFRRYADAVVEHQDSYPFAVPFQNRGHGNRRGLALFHSVQSVADNIQKRSMQSLRVGRNHGQVLGEACFQLDVHLLHAAPKELEDVPDDAIDIGVFNGRLAFLRVAEHVHDQVVNLALVLLDNIPALLQEVFVLVGQAHLEDFAAAAQALQDVFD